MTKANIVHIAWQHTKHCIEIPSVHLLRLHSIPMQGIYFGVQCKFHLLLTFLFRAVTLVAVDSHSRLDCSSWISALLQCEHWTVMCTAAMRAASFCGDLLVFYLICRQTVTKRPKDRPRQRQPPRNCPLPHQVNL